jgi:hypothetical protein
LEDGRKLVHRAGEPAGELVRDDELRPLLQRYVDAFECYDLDSLVSLLRRAVQPSGGE